MLTSTQKRAVAGVAAGFLTLMGVAAAAPSGSAAADAALQTLRVTAHTTAQHSTGKTSFVSSDTDRSPRTGAIVGYDVISGKIDPSTGKITLYVAAALKGGTIDMIFKGTSGSFHGKITGGSGKYTTIVGTATAVSPSDTSPITHVVLKYHL
jgi:hypothetical protein